ncbi:MAG: FecR domain-containing protein [Bacteroidales bacterium]|nr:FecR domain-containing protein [Bacteroidales bacterium]
MKEKEKNNKTNDMTEKKMIEDFLSDQDETTGNYWKEMDEINRNRKADVDKAWNNLYGRLEADGLVESKKPGVFARPVYRIAASVVVLMALTFAAIYLMNKTPGTYGNIARTGPDQKNLELILPDGSQVVLNRNSSIEYPDKFSAENRMVKLEGEAFFDVSPDESLPFMIDACKADVTVLGTSFNVNNNNDRVEVLVSTGKVRLSNKAGDQSLTLEPGEIGAMDNSVASKNVNKDPNYLAWKTEVLRFEGDRLEKVFRDLNRVHNINIEVENQEINELRLSSVFENQPPDTIIRIICTSFNLDYEKEGEIYSLRIK